MFDDGDGLPGARLFGLPPGADFPAAFADGLVDRLGASPPQDWARVEIFVNTRRMQRRLREILSNGPARLLPRLRMITDLGASASSDLPPPVSGLRRRLELAALINALVQQDASAAPRGAVHDLATSLNALLDEMEGEGIPLDSLATLDVSDTSGHWKRALKFVEIAARYVETLGLPGGEARQRAAVMARIAAWERDPPRHPILIIGSTGSRGTTAMLMRAAARLPQGAVLLPGYDFDMPERVWDRLDEPLTSEDHPQYRFVRLARDMDLGFGDIARWTQERPVAARNRLISLALRPAPVTDQWMEDGRRLDDLAGATAPMTLIEASGPRQEALAIALRLRAAAQDGQRAALITTDRMLSRQVTAALDRWRIEPDDSAGRPLGLSAPGRLLRQVAEGMAARPDGETFLALLKHPLCHAGAQRNLHLLRTRELELWMRRNARPFIDAACLADWAATRSDPEDTAWAHWVDAHVLASPVEGTSALPDLVERLAGCAAEIVAGPLGTADPLWSAAAGRAAAEAIAELRLEAVHGAEMTAGEFRTLLDAVLAGREVRDPVEPHPEIMIWGTLEARVQGADLVILGGLNDRVWPEQPAADPWLNRQMRRQLGMLLPDRRIGLSAHDFQQAVAAPEVVLTRAVRNSETETVVSRWLNRMLNLLDGLPEQGGPQALAQMRARGAHWLRMAAAADTRLIAAPPASRPAPRPPTDRRPRQLSVTRIQTLIRDPYAIYAREVLNLKPLKPLQVNPDAPLRGTIVHDIFEAFIGTGMAPDDPRAAETLRGIVHETLTREVPWHSTRTFWRNRVERVIAPFLAGEIDRRAEGMPIRLEGNGKLTLPSVEFTLVGKADRIDQRSDGRLLIYDYKTGKPPDKKVMAHFDKQLLLEAVMAEQGAFDGVPAAPVAEVGYIGLGGDATFIRMPLRQHEDETPLDPACTRDELIRLISSYARRQTGYTARRAMQKMQWQGDYDHLARFGEWADSDPVCPEDVG
ncbi:double-strand break repair protein AddB [Profundibacterium mesophilum]|uniref:Inactivated superfamily I helicase DNA replication n=1 Tax=Profundibacterium mesophilum KAUST100406-0324 TaxID=1037889 RepID=A0A921TD12_9RHOB|nr:double-strand break repair protein AddB [Profundibacterium mesophilum]KAF0676303.1 Inactivated superfamily I helicase DNA replication [Profundibacterium mesophilum KAUST100406-0324]